MTVYKSNLILQTPSLKILHKQERISVQASKTAHGSWIVVTLQNSTNALNLILQVGKHF